MHKLHNNKIINYDGIHFSGGGFKTMYYFGVLQYLIENKKMPEYYSGKSAGAFAAMIGIALSSVSSEKRQEFLNYAKFIFETELVEKTAPLNKNWCKCEIAAKQTIHICKKIQPYILKYTNKLTLYITHINSWSLNKKNTWNNWEELEIDLRAGSSIPFIQDYCLVNDSENKLSMDGCFIRSKKPTNYIHVSCAQNLKANIYPRYCIPNWYNTIINPIHTNLNDWYNDAYFSSYIFDNLHYFNNN
tara:strand:+ start:6181 stop:6915 length:735 start_codon:yes stop_codon:yes gene_type:complete